ncbi:MAG: response regulator [Balneolales bacterium]
MPPEKPDSELKSTTILLIEDDSVNRLLLNIILKKINPDFDIQEAVNGKEGLDQFIKKQPDLIFMDIHMPVMNGYEATVAIRNLENGKDVPIIAFTALTQKSDREKCFNAGINDHVSKPVAIESIQKTTYKWLGLTTED